MVVRKEAEASWDMLLDEPVFGVMGMSNLCTDVFRAAGVRVKISI